jgi:hypothetical protein
MLRRGRGHSSVVLYIKFELFGSVCWHEPMCTNLLASVASDLRAVVVQDDDLLVLPELMLSKALQIAGDVHSMDICWSGGY